jgi:hypothetical protein
MNCQDVARIVNLRSLDDVTGDEGREIEAHALSCPHCAADWAMHSRLAALKIPPMPAELVARCRTLAVANAPVFRARHRARRLVLIGSLAALAAAAASMLVVRQADTPSPQPMPAAAATSLVREEPLAQSSTAAPNAAPSTVRKTAAATSLVQEEPVAQPSTAAPNAAPSAVRRTAAPPTLVKQPLPQDLPLLPAPTLNFAERETKIEQGLQKAIERHPEIVLGSDTNDTFVVSITLLPDGGVHSSAARLVPREKIADTISELARTTPEATGYASANRKKGTTLPDGRILRANLHLEIVTLPPGYDDPRSYARVREVLRGKYTDQMQPATRVMSRLTVFLSENGTIERESLENPRTEDVRAQAASEPSNAQQLAEQIATQLAMDVDQIGLVGTTLLEEGSLSVVVRDDGTMRTNDTRRLLLVRYAWPRSAGELAPTWSRPRGTNPITNIDLGAALKIVEHHIPDAFAVTDSSAGTPTVILTAKGEVIRAGRVTVKAGEVLSDRLAQDQLAPGVRTNISTFRTLTNAAGTKTTVFFAWESPVPEAQSARK